MLAAPPNRLYVVRFETVAYLRSILVLVVDFGIAPCLKRI
jgi:hypothetical protein